MTSNAVDAPHQRFDRYLMWTLYAALPCFPAVSLLVLAPSDWSWPTIGHVIALLLATALGYPVIRGTMGRAMLGTPWPVARIIPFVVASLAAAALGAMATVTESSSGLDIPTLLVMISLTLACIGIAPPLTWRQAAVPALAAAAITTLASVWIQGLGVDEIRAGRWFPVLFSSSMVTLVLTWSVSLTVWMQRQMQEQAELTEVRSELAVAEERLRFSRDLHDIFGRTLTAVTLKADLAAELSDAGRADDASTQMREVHSLAEDALREVRAVVGGYRGIDLAAELRGARALLVAAGIKTRIIGGAEDLPPTVAESLAWVVREGATNVVHHSQASVATFTLARHDDATTLTITNDGATRAGAPVPGGRRGSGLVGLADRIAPLGGTLATTNESGSFTLTATIPTEA